MGSKTYKARALVLKKTKLKEKDLIVTMLDADGRLLQAVARGARKPGGSYAARLELFSEVDVLLAEGRTLDVVCDARIVDVRNSAPGIEQSSCAAVLAKLLCSISQPDLTQPRVYAMSKAALDFMLDAQMTPGQALAICCASLWKVLSQAGFRPSFSRCALCAERLEEAGDTCQVAVSVEDGGVVCRRCQRPADAIVVDANTVRWCDALIALRYGDVLEAGIDPATCFEILHLSRLWARHHTGRDLKSLDFLFAPGLFA